MRIAFLPSSYIPESLGGTEIYVHQLSQALVALGHQVAVVLHAAGTNSAACEDGYQVFRLPEYLPQRRADLYLHGRGDDPKEFSRLLDEWLPDVVHFHALTLGAGLDHARAVRRRGLPYFITYHTPTFSCHRGTLMRWGNEVCDGVIRPRLCTACTLHGYRVPKLLAGLLALSPLPWALLPDGPWIPRLALPSLLKDGLRAWREFMHGAAHLVACADWCRRLLVDNGLPTERVSVHRQALPGENRTRRLRLPLPERRPLRLGFFGRFSWIKGPDLFLDGLRCLQNRGVSAVGELVGPVAEPEQAWADQLLAKASGQATYLGIKRESALTEWVDTLDLVVIPSRWLETGPLTLLEAWDCGVPVVGADLGGIPDFMRSGPMDELLFRPEDPHSLADAVLRAINWQGLPGPEVSIPGMAALGRRMEGLYQAAVCQPRLRPPIACSGRK